MQAPQFKDFAEAHRSIRSYQSTPIDQALLESIVHTGLRASSAGNMQSWSVVLTENQCTRQLLYKAHREQDMILEAPCVLTFCSDFNRIRRWLDLSKAAPSFDDFLGFLTGMADALIAAQNMALAAEAHGLGICYMGTTLWAMEEIGEILELPKYVAPVTSFVMGYPSEDPTLRPRLALEAVLHREKYEKRADEQILELYAQNEKATLKRLEERPEILERECKLFCVTG